MAWQLSYEPVPNALQVLHLCDRVVRVGDFVAIKDDFRTVVTDAGASCWSSRRLLALTANRRVRVGFAF